MRAAAVLISLAGLLLAPICAAEQASGTLVADGTIEFPAGSELQANPTSLYMGDATSLVELRFHASHVHMDGRWRQANTVVAVVLPPKERPTDLANSPTPWSYDLTNVTGDLAEGDQAGQLGVYFSSASPRPVVAAARTTLEVTSEGPGKAGVASTTDEGPGTPDYVKALPDPHVTWSIIGEIRIPGPWALKLNGPDVGIKANENSTILRTGVETKPGQVPVATEDTNRTWATLSADDGELIISTLGPIAMTAPDCAIDWSGAIRLNAVAGSIVTSTTTYGPTGQTLTLDGTMSTLLAPARERGQTTLEFRGDLKQSSMATVPVPSGTELSGTIWAIVIAGTVVVILLVGGLVHLRRRRHDDLQVDDLLALADAAAEGGQFDVAREWAARARKILPDSPRVLVDHGFFSAECGDFDAALEAYERAAERSEDGEPEFLASQLLLKHFGRADEAATLLLRALRKAPELAFEADEVPEFAALKTRLEVRLALERSRRRAGSG